jgi:adenosylmethionine-8-amino-7-oxononanoate aminotransferase
MDRDGAIFDATSSWWVNLFGHSDAGLISEAIAPTRLATLPHVMLAGLHARPGGGVGRGPARSSRKAGSATPSYGSDGASAPPRSR